MARIIADWRWSAKDDSSSGARRLIEAIVQIEEWIASRADGSQETPAIVIDPEAIPPSDPPVVVASTTNTPPLKITDPVGFPMIWIEEIGAFMHWLPVTKIQFEKFVASSSGGFFDDAWYRRILDLNPRVATAKIVRRTTATPLSPASFPTKRADSPPGAAESIHYPPPQTGRRRTRLSRLRR